LCKIQCFRFISHFLWITLTFISFVTFLGSFSFGVLSSLAYDANYVIDYIFSDDNLFNNQYLIRNKEAADILNVCLNYGGDIGTELYDLRNTNMIYLDKLYQFSYNIQGKDFKLNLVSQEINNQMKELKILADNISLVTNSSNDNTLLPQRLLNEFQRWTDFNTLNNYQNKYDCKTNTKDIWVFKDSSCPPGSSKNITISNGKENLGLSNCFIIDTWLEIYVNKRYDENPYNCDGIVKDGAKTNEIVDKDFKSFKEAILAYWRVLKNYKNWHSTTFNALIERYGE